MELETLEEAQTRLAEKWASKPKVALIFGVHGQAGSFLSEILLEKGYRVIGVARRTSLPNDERIKHIYINKNFSVVCGDVTDYPSIHRLISRYYPNEVYNLAAQSHVKVSFDEPIHTTNVVYGGCLNILEAIRDVQQGTNSIKMLQASSSEMFGSSRSSKSVNGKELFYQDETTPYSPRSPYAIAKLAAHHAVRLYRESYGLHASAAIMLNYESERRGEQFVTRKITKYVADLYVNGYKQKLRLGNIKAKRDWGYAGDTMKAVHLMLQQEKSDDYVIATGEVHSVEDFLVEAFRYIDKDWQQYVEIDYSLLRPSEVDYLCGDASKARKVLGWQPTVGFTDLVKKMVSNDISLLNR